MTWQTKEYKDNKWLTIFARNTDTNEAKSVRRIRLPTLCEKLTRSKRYKKDWIWETHVANLICNDLNRDEMREKIEQHHQHHQPDKPFTCGKCGSDSWKLIARRWGTGHFLQFHCAECGHSDNIISYDSKVSNIEKLVDADMLPNGSQYNPDVEYVSRKGKATI